MYIVDKKVFIHVVKCGGSALRESLYEHREDDIKFISQHFPLKRISKEFENYATYGLVRDPIEWYKSAYAYTIQLHDKGESFSILMDALVYNFEFDKTPSFDKYIDRCLNLKVFLSENGIIQEIHRKVRGRKLLSASYFQLAIPDWTDEQATIDLYGQTAYQAFLSMVGMWDVENVYSLEDNSEELYEEFGLPKEASKVVDNKGKNKNSVGVVSEDIKEKIRVADKRVYTTFNLKVR